MSGYSLSRRNVMKGLGAASAASFVPGSLNAQTQELVIVATGGAFEKALKDHFYDVFTQQTGIRIRPVAASNSETWTKLRAMQQTNNIEWDIVTAWPEDLVAQQALIESFDCGKLTNLAAQGVPGACQSRGLLRTLGGVTITYDRSKYPNGGPQNWADFWNVQKFPGPRSLPNAGAPWWPLMAALMADGVAKDKLFPLDLDRAFKKLDEIRPHVNVWWRTGDQSQQMFRSGEVTMAMMWSGRAFALADQNMPLEVVWSGAPPNTALWSIVKGTKNTEAAIKFLDFFMSRPEAHLPFANAVNFDTANRSVLSSLTPAQLKTKVTAPENAAQLAVMDAAWVAENRAALLERWNRWLAR
jgi:mannopine transport system substrate-binding protein